ncbi:DUF4118 domain-containing protein [Streptomyces sp. NBC_01456]|uniref:DUF4118 domain-containing protein n=1 Tax=unclassified Streptomyces TaxID=2593676 RepID=UPI002E37871A|nr:MULTISPECIES: DUF4118 domain-containing protein [unclassified Streptomyces]
MAVLHRPVSVHRPRCHLPLSRATALRARPARPALRRGTLVRDLALPLGAVGAALLVTALTLAGPGARAPVAPAVFVLLTVAVAALARPVAVPGVALVSWLFYDGFVLNGHSDLAFRAQDRTGLLVLCCAAAAGACGAAALRAVRRRTAG